MTRWLLIIGTGLVTLPLVACGEKGTEDNDGDTGGTGATGVGGSATGGTGTGGTATGGTSTGGTATGGTGTGGTPSTGGTGGSEPVPADTFFTFDTDVMGFAPNYASSATGVPLVVIEDVTAEHTDADGHDDPGALAITIPYDQAGQYVGIGLNTTTIDMTGRTITAWVKLESGLGDPTELMTNPGGAKLYAKSGMGYCYANGPYNNIGDVAAREHGVWFSITFNLSRPPDYVDPNCTFEPADIREFGIQFDTGGMAPSATTAVFHVDDISY